MAAFGARVEIIFAHILVFPACAIEVQHINENSPTIFIDMFAPKWARGPHKFSTFSLLGPLHYPWVLSMVFKCFAKIRITFQIAFLCVHAPRGHVYLRFLPPPPPLSDENPVMLHFFPYAEIIFAHILVIPR